jgi:hypothetical protein
MNGIERIAAERKRQIEEEGFTEIDDVYWESGELARAAMCYCMEPDIDYEAGDEPAIPKEWPWEDQWWKPTPDNRIRELEKAGALIAAEIDRILLLENKQEGENT